MDDERRQSLLDNLRQEEAANKDAFDQIAIAIARADIPISKDPAGKPTAKEKDATPADWINNYAEGLARSGKCSHEEAIAGVRAAFENRYRMSPEAYMEQYGSRKAIKDNAIASAIAKVKTKEEEEHRRDSRDQERDREK